MGGDGCGAGPWARRLVLEVPAPLRGGARGAARPGHLAVCARASACDACMIVACVASFFAFFCVSSNNLPRLVAATNGFAWSCMFLHAGAMASDVQGATVPISCHGCMPWCLAMVAHIFAAAHVSTTQIYLGMHMSSVNMWRLSVIANPSAPLGGERVGSRVLRGPTGVLSGGRSERRVGGGCFAWRHRMSCHGACVCVQCSKCTMQGVPCKMSNVLCKV